MTLTDASQQGIECNGLADSGLNGILIPAGVAHVGIEASSAPVRIVDLPGSGQYVLQASLIKSDNTLQPVVWTIDMLHNWSGAQAVEDVVKERRVFIGTSIMDVPVTLPCRISMIGMDGAASFTANIAWKVKKESSISAPAMRESCVRKLDNVAGGGFAPVDPAAPNYLLFPIGSELLPGLITPSKSGFGWRPNQLVVRKRVPTDDINVYVAQGSLVAGFPQLGIIKIPAGTAEATMTVDPTWSGGVIVANNLVGATGQILFIWSKQ